MQLFPSAVWNKTSVIIRTLQQGDNRDINTFIQKEQRKNDTMCVHVCFTGFIDTLNNADDLFNQVQQSLQ